MARPLALCALLLFGAARSRAGELLEALESRWLGVWVVSRGEIGSDCDHLFTNNRVVAGRAVHSASQTLPAGELGKVVKLKVQRARIDVFVELAEPLRTSRRDGPFELFEQPVCRIELQMTVPRPLIRAKDAAAAEEIFARLLERHESRQAATASPAWNRRRVQPLPDDYQRTLEEHRRWREAQLAAQLDRRLEEALDEASEILERARRSEAFGAGLAAGLQVARSWGLDRRCEDLADARSYPSSADAPDGYAGGDGREWEDGYRDGQRLAFAVELADRLALCRR